MQFSVAIWGQKVIKAGVKALIAATFAFFTAHHIDLTKYGITIDQELLAGTLTVVGVAGLEAVRNYLKTKFKVAWL